MKNFIKFRNSTFSVSNSVITTIAKNNLNLLLFGLFLSVVLVGTLARFFAEKIKKYKWLGYLGLLAILIVALQLIIGGLIDLNILSVNETFKKYF